ncbi:hypothetical protein A1O1_01325 [Capronia coronata CBS 617.96]|uniref:Major facilitator superfamily (MFS) profile domain-containing protein n=1 Tax=Capronia coronata CBS 617.96 TaxID=1182541 RepID=W9ZNX1_9EURO|nr:uncharacterized protein A1O1_01325 [Capronia coronata CBS 617.96]EXJ96199.1 hypothetical protein A1O1_01325 [Capronia coronata CBS 617.96]
MPSPPSGIPRQSENHDNVAESNSSSPGSPLEPSSREDLQKSLGQNAIYENPHPHPPRWAKQPPTRPSLAPGISAMARRPSFIDEEEDSIATATAADRSSKISSKETSVTWMSLPKKGQLAILTIARLSEPLTERSLAAYMFYQLRFFDSSLPDSTIASQGGMLTASFAAAQFLTAVWWGRAADTPWIGRKRVLLVGLFGTCVSCVGVGFSRSFAQALFFRACAGCLNGNVGVMRTMISEIIKEKKYQSRAFLLLPMCFNIGVVIGPILGGFLADPITSFPHLFGPDSVLGGKKGVKWMEAFPYALPNVVSACFILVSALCVVLGLDETHPALSNKQDYGRKLGNWIFRFVARCFHHNKRPSGYEYTQLDDDNQDQIQVELQPTSTSTSTTIHNHDHDHDHDNNNDNDNAHDQVSSQQDRDIESSPSPFPLREAAAATAAAPTNISLLVVKLPFRQIFTKNVLLTLLTHHLLALHLSAFNALIFLFLPAPRSPNSHAHLPFQFTGGLGLSSERVGLATAIIGVLGFPLQILLYPSVNSKLGTLRSYKVFLPFSVLAYAIIPYLALVPDRAVLVWPALTLVLALQVLSRTFALPSGTILVNNCTPHPSVLGTIHGVAQSVSSGARTVGPTLGGYLLGVGLGGNCVGAVWWAAAGVAVLNWVLLWFVFEGDAGSSVG